MATRLDVPDDWGISGKVAVVMGGGAAGAGVGNGRAAAILLARAGARVVVVDRTIDLAEQTVAMIKEQGGEALALEADITRPEDCAMVVKAALDRFGRLDLLDNNVGIGSRAERVIVISSGLILAPLGVPLQWFIYLLAVTAWLTVLQRILSVRKQLRKETDGFIQR